MNAFVGQGEGLGYEPFTIVAPDGYHYEKPVG